jgi:MFS family permease
LIGLFATFGSVLCMWLLPVLADRYGLIWAVSSGIILNAFSLLCALTSTFLDRKFETRMLEES